MLKSSFLVLLVVAHVLLATTVATAQLRLPKWLAPAIGTFATSLFGVLAIAAQNIETIADDGSITTTSELVVGIYAIGLAAVSLLLTAVLLIDWLPTGGFTGGSSSGY
jgi:hypothetical protein